MKGNVIAVMVVAGLLMAPIANGQTMLKQDAGFYVGASVGQAKDREFCGDARSVGFTGCDDKEIAWKLHGGYQFNQNLGVELGYVNFGKFEATAPGVTGSVKARAVELLGIGSFPVWQQFSVYGKFGFFRWDADAEVAGGGLVLRGGDKGTDLTYGVGASYAFNPNIAVRLDWQRYTDVDVNILSLGVLYKFR
jgi:OOP family OmpA-OmpF porin